MLAVHNDCFVLFLAQKCLFLCFCLFVVVVVFFLWLSRLRALVLTVLTIVIKNSLFFLSVPCSKSSLKNIRSKLYIALFFQLPACKKPILGAYLAK